jgi:hypothetical protein
MDKLQGWAPMPKKNEVETKLTSADKKAFAKHEETIRSGLTSFIEVGHALAEIRDSRLYREDFETFEDYCASRWDLVRRAAYNRIAAAEVVDEIRRVQNSAHVPLVESHALEVAAAGDNAAKVWAAVLKQSPKLADGSPCTTAKKIAAIRDAMLAPKPKQESKPKDEPPRTDKATDTAVSPPEDEPSKLVNGKQEDKEEKPTGDNPFPEQAERMQTIARQLSDLAGRIETAQETIAKFKGEGFAGLPNGENIGISLTNVIASLKSHAASIKGAAPACMCLDCGGKGCLFCGHRRWQTAEEKRSAESRRKARETVGKAGARA